MADLGFIGRNRRDSVSKNLPQGVRFNFIPDACRCSMGIDRSDIRRR